MKLHFCKIDTGNFGDDMNEWFWDDVFPEYHDLFPDMTMFGIGSLLWLSAINEHSKILVMGSGTGVGIIPKIIPPHLNFAWVRGPLTAKEMGLSSDFAIADAAIMSPLLNRFSDAGAKREGTAFVPHCGTERLPLNWQKVTERAGVRLISPSADAASVIRQIASSERIIAESMHAAIIADAFRVPWIPLALTPDFNYFKWRDWGASVETDFEVFIGLKNFKDIVRLTQRARMKFKGDPRRIPDNENPESQVRVPNMEMPEWDKAPRMNSKIKDRIKRFAGLGAPIIEQALVSDLRKAKTARTYMSSDAIMGSRQKQLLERIDRLRGGEIPSR